MSLMLGLRLSRIKYKKIGYLLQIIVLFLLPLLAIRPVSADVLTQRKVTISNPIAGGTVRHTFNFNITTADTLGSIQFQYCDNDPLFDTPCTTPPGLDLTGAVLSSQTGETGFTIHASSTASNLILTRTSSPSLAGPVEYVLDNVINPSTPNSSTYVRISTFQTLDASGTRTDRGGVVFATAGSFGAAAFVPPFLLFCVGVTISGTCSSYSGDSVSFGNLSTTQVKSVTTQSAAATNDPTGYIIYTLGTTLTSGNNTIAAMGIPNPSLAGFSQFGLNMRDNNNPNAGQDVSGIGSGSVLANYNTPDLYMFSPGDAIAQSTLPTEYNVYTTTYIANISPSQPAGVYVTTVTYMAVAQF